MKNRNFEQYGLSSTVFNVPEEEVVLVAGKGTPGKGGGPGGQYWSVFFGGFRAGSVYINRISDDTLGEHYSLQIFLNKPMQRKGIGTIAYRKACLASGLNRIYLHMSKSNTASFKAALKAGFVEVTDIKTRQRLMVWTDQRIGE
ncbi:MAG: N-acetyltransferase [Bdellovibrionaceae bacterium]|nr:N-acetyltransferase [Pseudobdellovibrionaceae bacterium]|tara:strand:+ start:87 stop:518 length:432 start_codon:yes stop_codon:yes gene_type:complete